MRVKLRTRAIALLAAGVLVGALIMAVPATAHVGGTVGHLVGHLKAFFYTKSQSDARYLNTRAKTGDVLTGYLSARYVPHSPNPFFLVAGSYPSRLKVNTPAPTVEWVPGAPTATCPGFGKATTGRLCIYGVNTDNLPASPVNSSGGSSGNARYFGFSLDVFPADDTMPAWLIATWAYKVQAPPATPRPLPRACASPGVGSC
jgi:hypothetical protein